ncbi:MAG: epoxide hydrolase [Caulobacteraceae bacterium]|nr:epoxide hydrolase [Caulobacteraceae bacterium]
MIETLEIRVGLHTFAVDMTGPADGASVLLLHGFPETRHMWRAQLEALAEQGFRAVAPDQRGYSAGARPSATDAYATEHLVADALGMMDALGAPRFHLVGHDWGGQLAWLIAAGHADRLLSLSVLSRPHPAAFARAMAEDAAQAERSRHHRAFRREDAVARMREAKLGPLREAILAQGVPPPDAEIYLATLMQPGGIEGAMAWYRASGVAGADTPAVAAPTLYVWGDADATVGRRAAELTAEHVTGPYRFVTLEGAGHFLVDQLPERVSDLIIGHLQDRTTTP